MGEFGDCDTYFIVASTLLQCIRRIKSIATTKNETSLRDLVRHPPSRGTKACYSVTLEPAVLSLP